MANLSADLKAPNGKEWTQPLGLFINNEFVAARGGRTIATVDPATEIEIAKVHAASAEDVDLAVQAAKAALSSTWSTITATERSAYMLRLADLIEQNKEILATIDAWDNGKTYSAALSDDVSEIMGCLRYYSGWADKTYGQTINSGKAKFAFTIRKPVGVCGQIIPWNYPLGMAGWKLGPALACGNTVVLKAAEQTPLSVLVLGRLIKEAGFPPGVVNIINGYGAEAGSALVNHPLVDKIAFTGSTNTGRQIMKSAANTLKNVTLETGGKSPLLVFEDANLNEAVQWSHYGIMGNQGQICTATSRILVHESIYDTFVSMFLKTVKEVSKIGDQWDETAFQGPQVTKAQYDNILSLIDVGRREGATVALGGTPHPGKDGKGFFINPTVFTDVKEDMTIYREEIFGPVVVIASFEGEKDAIRRANDTTFGLGAAVFTQDLQRALRVAPAIESGMVWVNSSQDSDYRIPFGGVKQSGVGRELGEAGLEAYSTVQSIHINVGPKA